MNVRRFCSTRSSVIVAVITVMEQFNTVLGYACCKNYALLVGLYLCRVFTGEGV